MKSLMHIVLGLVVSGSCIAETWTVDDDGFDFPNADFNNIQDAVDAANDGDEIHVYWGTYTSNHPGHVVNMLGKEVWLRGGVSIGSKPPFIDGENERRGFACVSGESSKTIIECVRVINGLGVNFDYDEDGFFDWWEDNGGGILIANNSSPQVKFTNFTDCNMDPDNGSANGGGVAIYGSSPTFYECLIRGCDAIGASGHGSGGGIYIRDSGPAGDPVYPTFTGGAISFNEASVGGGISVNCDNSSSATTFTNVDFRLNVAHYIDGFGQSGLGGASKFTGGTVDLDHCRFSENYAGNDGGAILLGTCDSVAIRYCTIENNESPSAGGIYIFNSYPELTDTVVCGNTELQIIADGGGDYIETGSIVAEECPIGACCFTNQCVDDFISLECINFGGVYNGEGSSCDSNPCDDSTNTTWVVDDDGKADFDNIQAAVDAAIDGDEIIVAPGTYTSTEDEVVNMRGKEIWLHSSGGAEVTIINGQGKRRGLYCVNAETSNTIIEGFMITSCNTYNDNGGGMFNGNSNPTLKDCTFTNNTSNDNGGGMFNTNSSPTLIRCTFMDNHAVSDAGGMWNGENSSPTLEDCSFTNNTSGDSGGGMRNRNDSNPTLMNCTFTGNTAENDGGGMYNTYCSPILTDTTVCGNTPNQIYGDWIDNGGNTIADECPECPDINGDGYVNVTDLLAVIDQWELTDSPADVTGDGIVNVSDLLLIISNWGECE